jgi:hypothetical protein
LSESAAPQSPQKRLFGGLSAPHLGQTLASCAPQSPQNLFPLGLSLPQLEQRISSPGVNRFASHLSFSLHRGYRITQSRVTSVWPHPSWALSEVQVRAVVAAIEQDEVV